MTPKNKTATLSSSASGKRAARTSLRSGGFSVTKARKDIVAGALGLRRRTFEEAVEKAVAHPLGTRVLLDAFRELSDKHSSRAAKRLVYLASNRANEVTRVTGCPTFQAMGFTLPFLCVSPSTREYAGCELPRKLTTDISTVFQQAVGLPESVVVQIDPHLYRDAEFMAVGPSEARQYFDRAAQAVLRAEDISPLPTVEQGRGRCCGVGAERGLDHAAYLLVGTVVLPISERADVNTVLAVCRLRDTLLNNKEAMVPVVAAALEAVKEVLPGTTGLTHITTDDRLDLMGQIMTRVYSDMEKWQASRA